MNWITNFVRPKFPNVFRKDENDDNLWMKCPACGEMIFHQEAADTHKVCSACNHHMRLNATERFKQIFDNGHYEQIDTPDVPLDPLKFKDDKKYSDRIKTARAKTGQKDAICIGKGTLDGEAAIIAVQDFFFMGGSLGMAAGEAVIKAAETALEHKLPLIMITAAGGARMQEGILSLMQMPRTTVLVQALREHGLPYIVVLTNPTTGGVTASYGMLGDIHIAEPGALIGFAGPRVIKDTIKEKLPEGFQTAEYLRNHGMVDMVVHRHELRETIGRIIRLLRHDAAA